MSFYSFMRNATITTSSYLTGVAGSVVAPAYTPAVVTPVARCAFHYAYGAPATWMAAATERFMVSAAVSAALPYAPAVGAAAGGIIGMAVTTAAFCAVEATARTASTIYQHRCNRNSWRALGNQHFDLSEGNNVEEGQWVDIVRNSQQLAVGMAV